jgi:hypothetical protein
MEGKGDNDEVVIQFDSPKYLEPESETEQQHHEA